MGKFLNLYNTAIKSLGKLNWLPILLGRLSMGSLFMVTGWGKLHNIEKIVGFFTELGLPLPGFQAHLVATTEFVGGSLILLGLFTRLAAIPLSIVMIVAIVTAKKSDITGVIDLLSLDEFIYLIFFIWFLISGAGMISLDHFLKRRK